MKSIITILVSVFVTLPAMAGQNSPGTKIIKAAFSSTATTKIFVEEGKVVNPEKCLYSDFYAFEAEDTVYGRAALSALLAATSTKQKISFYVSGCDKRYNRPQILTVILQ